MKKVTLFMLLFFVNYCFSQKEKSTQLGQTTLEKLQMSVYKKDSSASAIVLMDQGNFYISNPKKRYYTTDYYSRIKIFTNTGLDEGNVEIIHLADEILSNINAITYNLDSDSTIEETPISKDNILVNKYNFDEENVVLLNNSPTENQILREFVKLKQKVTKKDNVLIFYAGHGIYDESTETGSWLPSDADPEYGLNMISNSTIKDYIKGINSKHTLLISDACFSGSIFKTRTYKTAPKSITRKFELPSRKAITSGTLKTVPNKSVFLK